ncbi:hypothetical protein [Carboxylicivirga sp. N1Y90]|uniref:hypothetical protein n=1 Tax=Carboxylicivirga fragile TaxID=3417571 RepID=UPI003D330906|nr:hypothetical protein [Marinilabiliaceae bacterium N1Y90]
MKTQSILVLFISLFIIACGPSREEIVKEKFETALSHFSNKQYNNAKLMIDSITEFYHDQIEYTTRAKDLLRTITIEEQKSNLAFLDSLLADNETALEPLMKNFRESSDYGPKKILIHKRQKPENSYNRIYLRAHLDLDGEFYISSRYTGESNINHKQIKVYFSGNHALSEAVEIDGFQNRHFDDGGTKWEVVNYKDGKDNGVIDFIASNADKSLKVQFIGKKHYYILMEKFDKEAIRDGYEISAVLKENKRITQEIKKVKKELKKLSAI